MAIRPRAERKMRGGVRTGTRRSGRDRVVVIPTVPGPGLRAIRTLMRWPRYCTGTDEVPYGVDVQRRLSRPMPGVAIVLGWVPALRRPRVPPVERSSSRDCAATRCGYRALKADDDLRDLLNEEHRPLKLRERRRRLRGRSTARLFVMYGRARHASFPERASRGGGVAGVARGTRTTRVVRTLSRLLELQDHQ